MVFLPEAGAEVNAPAACVHCGLDCPPNPPRLEDHVFCCHGCRAVYQLLSDHGMERFYDLDANPGVRPPDTPGVYAALDQPEVRNRIVDFSNGSITRVTFRIPAMHCAACVWLLEHLYRLVPGVGRSEVNFPRKEVTILIEEESLALSTLAEKLAGLGYPPELKLDRLSGLADGSAHRRLVLQIGVAGFAFGNVMMLSFPSYLGLDPVREADFQALFGWVSLLLSIPVLLFSARDFFRGAWNGLRQRYLTIDFPLALGIGALFAQSVADIVRGAGEGYLDSFTGLVFLLLCGRWFQRRTFDALSFDRDYRSYFPLSVTRRRDGADEAVALTDLAPGDRVVIRHGEIVPADAILLRGDAHLDYSFVTGESDLTPAVSGDRVFAGGRQIGGALEVELVKDVSQSYLTSLWNSETFRKPREQDLQNLTDRAGRWFTAAIVVIAAGTALYWWKVDPSMIPRTFAAVLIVACPCALALAAPFTFSAAQRRLGQAGLFLRGPNVVESLAKADTLVFDKTGTLTRGTSAGATFEGAPLPPEEASAVAALASHSSHPVSRAVASALFRDPSGTLPAVTGFAESSGSGIRGVVEGRNIALGSASWLGLKVPDGHGTWLCIDDVPRGRFLIGHDERPGLRPLLQRLRSAGARLALLSGDRPDAEASFRSLFGPEADLRFEQSPHDKLDYIKARQAEGRRVLMLGDGLNDAGALRQSDAGIAVSDDVTLFSPACDAILAGDAVPRLPDLLRFTRAAKRVLVAAFVLSLTYNVTGVSFAASGYLSPLVSAILMPLSSFSVIAFTTLATTWMARRAGVGS